MVGEYVLRKDCSKVWAIHYSKRKKLPYYYNRITRESYWERPVELRDEDIILPEDFEILQSAPKAADSGGENSRIAKRDDVLSKAIDQIKRSKSHVEQDSGVVDVIDLHNDLITDNCDLSFLSDRVNQTQCENKNPRNLGPVVTSLDLDESIFVRRNDGILVKTIEHNRQCNKSKRNKAKRQYHNKLYENFVSGNNRRALYNERRKAKKRIQKVSNNDNVFDDEPNQLLQSGHLVRPISKDKKMNWKKAGSSRNARDLEIFQKYNGDIIPRKYSLRNQGKKSVDEHRSRPVSSINNRNNDKHHISSSSSNKIYETNSSNKVDPISPTLSSLHSYSSDEEVNINNGRNYVVDDKFNTGRSVNGPVPSSKEGSRLMDVEQPSQILVNYASPGSENSDCFSELQSHKYEEMDWEVCVPENEIIKNIVEVRKELATSDSPSEIVLMDICEENPVPCDAVNTFIVIDTNVFISNLNVVKKMLNVTLEDGSGVMVVVPWQVLQELDKLKTRSKIGNVCAAAIDFICKSLLAKHPSVIAQSSKQHFLKTEGMKRFEIPDDAIMNCCLQLIDQNKNVILCTNDKNLVAKAFACDIDVTTAIGLMEKIDVCPDFWKADNDIRPPEIKDFKNIYNNVISNSNISDGGKRSNSNLNKGNDTNNSVESMKGNVSFNNCSKSVLAKRQYATLYNKGNTNKKSDPAVENAVSSKLKRGQSINDSPALDRMSTCSDYIPLNSNSSTSPICSKLPKFENTELRQRSPTKLLNLKLPSLSNNRPQQDRPKTNLIQSEDDWLIEFQCTTRKLLETILVERMHDEFGFNWEKRVIRTPPWQLSDLYFCLMTHWMTVTGGFLTQRTKKVLIKLHSLLRRKDASRYTVKDFEGIIRLSLQLCNELDKKFPELVNECRVKLTELNSSWIDIRKDPSVILNDLSSTPLSSDVTSSVLSTALKDVESLCENLSNALGLKDVCQKSNVNPGSEKCFTLDILKGLLPKFNAFLNEFVDSSKRLLAADPEVLTIDNMDIEIMFLTLNGFVPLCDPDFSMDHVLYFIQNNWKDFKSSVSEFDKLKYNLAEFTSIIREKIQRHPIPHLR